MPWSKNNYPESMKNLDDRIRNKAIDIANALIDYGKMDEERAIPIAISKAKEWVDNN
jgi:uncharacterized protein YdaT